MKLYDRYQYQHDPEFKAWKDKMVHDKEKNRIWTIDSHMGFTIAWMSAGSIATFISGSEPICALSFLIGGVLGTLLGVMALWESL
jgi:hypothetical protein